MNYYPHHIGDYLRDTAHLSAVEDGTYRRMLDVYYASEKPLPVDFDWLCKLIRAREEIERESVHVVLQQFFEKREDGWHNKRADEEIRKGRKRIKAAKTNGKTGGRPKTHRVSEKNPLGSRSDNPIESSQKPKPKAKEQPPIPPSGAFVRFWNSWPSSSRKASRGKCEQIWEKGGFDSVAEQILAHVEVMKLSLDWRKDGGDYIPAPLVYLNQRRWEGAETAAPARKTVAL